MSNNFLSLSPSVDERDGTIAFDLIGFDLDGTMVDSAADIAAALNHALSSIGRGPLLLEVVQTLIGGGSRKLIADAAEITGGSDGVDLDAMLDALLLYYAANPCVHTSIYDGLVTALDALDEAGVRYAVVTNKTEHIARLVLQELGLLDRMAYVIGGDRLGPGRAKPAPDMLVDAMEATGASRMAFVGDTIYDVKAAAAANCPSIFMDFHASGANLGADHILTHFDELLPLLRSMKGGA